MPELPEVETTARAIIPLILGQTIADIQFFVPKLRYPVPSVTHLNGRKINNITRRAKYILIDLKGAETLVIHLGMSGRIMTSKPDSHGHFQLKTATAEIHLKDPRRFGLVLLIPTPEVPHHPLFKILGPEPLTDDFTGKVLHENLAKFRTPIKPTLMNPKVVVGVGNIYASESLFLAKISPKKPANKLSLKDCNRLVECIKITLLKVIETGGSSLRDFAHPSGQLGNFQNNFNVYDRAGQPCNVCKNPIQHMVQAQRSTYWCAHCQR